MPGKGKTPGKTEGAFHVSTLGVKGGHYAGEAGTITTV